MARKKTKEDLFEYTDKQKEEMWESVSNMIWKIINDFNNIQYCDKQDIYQAASIKLLNYIIPRYNPDRKVQFKDFAYVCLKNFITRKINELNKHNNRNMLCEDGLILSIAGEDLIDEEPFEEDILSLKINKIREMADDEESSLKEKERIVIKMFFNNSNITQREISEIFGFNHPSGVSAILSRMRRRLAREGFFDF